MRRAPPPKCDVPPQVREGTYSRLFEGDFAPHDEDQLKDLAERMCDSDEKRNAPERPERTVAMMSGYVYLGQFIDHDLTYDTTLLAKAHPRVGEIVNHRTPRLDLDSLYGKDSEAAGSVYNADGTLRLGPTTPLGNPQPPGGSSDDEDLDDLYRDVDGRACLVDPRDDENMLVAQVHVLFAKFHNGIIRLLKCRPDLAPDPGDPNIPRQARKLVTWIYQWIVVHEFLPSVVRMSTLDEVRGGGLRIYPRWLTPRDYPIALPVEFTVAAFRFGHSAVQESYTINGNTSVDTRKLMFLTNRGGGIGDGPNQTPSLPANCVVDWRYYFDDQGAVNRAQNIDTFITESLAHVPPQAIAAFRNEIELRTFSGNLPELKMRLPELTLLRGSRMRLPSGEEFAKRFGFLPLIDAREIPALERDRGFFSHPTFHQRTPLWYYLLREAILIDPVYESTPTDQSRVQKLGPMGSQIVVEVFFQVLSSDPQSIFNAGAAWRPPRFIFGSNTTEQPLCSMRDVVDFVRHV